MESGNIIIKQGRYPERHELETAEIFTKQGIDVIFLPESLTEKQKSADIEMNGIVWELKSPTGNSKRTIERIFNKAGKQSKNLILDFRRCPIFTENVKRDVTKQWQNKTHFRRLIVILKKNERLDFNR